MFEQHVKKGVHVGPSEKEEGALFRVTLRSLFIIPGARCLLNSVEKRAFTCADFCERPTMLNSSSVVITSCVSFCLRAANRVSGGAGGNVSADGGGGSDDAGDRVVVFVANPCLVRTVCQLPLGKHQVISSSQPPWVLFPLYR